MLPPLVGVLTGNVAGFVAAMGEARASAASTSSSSSAALGGMTALGKAAFLGLAGAAVVGGIAAVKMAGDFQASMTQLVTGAGETKANIGLVSKGILDMAAEVGTSAQDLASGMYSIESSGYRGAGALNVLKTAAEGAKVGHADLATVSNALTAAMKDYQLPAGAAVKVTNTLIAAVGAGNMHMQDLAGAMGTVGPAAATAKVSLAEVTAAIATMTVQGTPAADAATYLRQTILQMENPSAKAQKALRDVGLSGRQLAEDLGKKGLAATLAEATEAIGKKFPAGSSEYISHLADMVGGTKSMQAALELTGGNMATFRGNIKTVAGAAAQGGDSVAGWADTQKDFNFQVEQAKAWVGALGIQVGLVLIPFLQKGIQIGGQFVGFLKSHTEMAKMLGAAIAGPLVFAIGAYTVGMIQAAIASIPMVVAFIALNAPIIAIIAAIALLSAGVVYAYDHWGWFRGAVNAAGTDLKAFIGWLGSVVPPIWNAFTSDVSNAWNGLKAFGTWVSNTFGPILNAMGGGLQAAGGFLNAINPWAKHSPSLVENVLSGTTAIAGHYQTMARSVQGSMGSVGQSPATTGGALASLAGAAAGATASPASGSPISLSRNYQLQQLVQLLTDIRASQMRMERVGSIHSIWT
ncbi:MAG: phage tail tape measure protein [Candidatus Dormibacterales bacterium]